MTVGSRAELAGLEAAGRVVADTLQAMREAIAPGVTTGELDEIAAAILAERGAYSAPQLAYGFPGLACISVNDEIVHGVPGPRVIRPGDVVKIDVTAELDGFIADAARTVLVPPVSALARRLERCARVAFDAALQVAWPGRPVTNLGRAIESEVKRHGLFVVRELAGHGVGRRIHEPPSVPNFADPDVTDELTPGLVLAVEPIVTPEPTRSVEDRDGWTLKTYSGCLAAHYENTIVIREEGPLLITV